ncbi:MAG: histidine phosphatase family protein, partial [Desulfobacterales bacterium]|nr:histidine phosphatase family protein [Desulfobacterales bacterium]
MAMLYLIRHGKAGADWGSALDPGLDDTGWEQAKNTAERISNIGPLDIVSSPLARAWETSKPLSDIWDVIPRIEDRVGEIVSPTKNLAERAEWLKNIMIKNWSHLDTDLQSFRQGVIDALSEMRS